MRLPVILGAALCCLVAVGSVTAQRATVATGEVGNMSVQPLPGTSARIVRTGDGLTCQFQTTGLPAGHAFSVWIIITEPDTDVFVFNFGGGVSDANGNFVFAAHVNEGTIPPANGVNILRGGGDFDHARTADIFLVIRSHGPVIPGMQHLQFFTINGGCRPGEPNAGLCQDMQHVDY